MCIMGYTVVSSLGVYIEYLWCVLGDIQLYPPWVCIRGYTVVSSLSAYYGMYVYSHAMSMHSTHCGHVTHESKCNYSNNIIELW